MKQIILFLLLISCSSLDHGRTPASLLEKSKIYEKAVKSLSEDLKHYVYEVKSEKIAFMNLSSHTHYNPGSWKVVEDYIHKNKLESGEKFPKNLTSYLVNNNEFKHTMMNVNYVLNLQPDLAINFDDSVDKEHDIRIKINIPKKSKVFQNKANIIISEDTSVLIDLALSEERKSLTRLKLRTLNEVELQPSVKNIYFDALRKLKVDILLDYKMSSTETFKIFDFERINSKTAKIFKFSSLKEDQKLDNEMREVYNLYLCSKKKEKFSKRLLNVFSTSYESSCDQDLEKVTKENLLYQSSITLSRDLTKYPDVKTLDFESEYQSIQSVSENVSENKTVREEVSLKNIKGDKAYKEAVQSLINDLKPHVRTTARPRWLFNYNYSINGNQYNTEREKDGSLSLQNKSFYETARYQAQSFFESHKRMYGNSGNGLYFYIDPFELASSYTDLSRPVGTWLELPSKSNYIRSDQSYISKSTWDKIRDYVSWGYPESLYQLLDKLKDSERLKNIVYDTIKILKIDLLNYSYRNPDFLESFESKRNNTAKDFTTDAFVLINENLINTKTTIIFDNETFKRYKNNKKVRKLSAVIESNFAEGSRNAFKRIFNLESHYKKESQEKIDNEAEKIIKKYFFKPEELNYD